MSDSSSEDVVLDSSSSSPAVNEAASAPAEQPSSEPSVLDAVEAALKVGVEAGSPPASNRSETAEANPQQSGQDGENAEISDEEMKQYTPNAQNRIRELAAQRNTVRAQLDETTRERDEFKGEAEEFRQFKGYLSQHGISSQEANNSLEITRLIKSHDYDRAFKVVAPIFEELARRTGRVLDQDLENDVKLGHVPKERAHEIQRGRMSERVHAAREQDRTQREQETQAETEKRQWTEHVSTVATAADDWAKAKAGSDPDWNKKQDLVANAVGILVQREGFPKTKEAAIEMNERALKQVETTLRQFVPPPRSINPPRPNSGPPSPGNRPPPKTALEAVERALEG